jgi:hypothetical protein
MSPERTVPVPIVGEMDRSTSADTALRRGAGTTVALGQYCVQTRDQIEIIESAYALDTPDVAWQYRLTDLIAEQWGGTAASFLYDASGPTQLTCQRVVVRMAGERIIVDAPKSIPLDDPILRQGLFVTRPHLAQLVDLIGPELSETQGCRRVLDVVRELNPGPFSVVLRTLDRNQKGLFFALPSRPIGDRMRAMARWRACRSGHRSLRLLSTSSGSDHTKGDPAVLRRAAAGDRQRAPGRGAVGAGHPDPAHPRGSV